MTDSDGAGSPMRISPDFSESQSESEGWEPWAATTVTIAPRAKSSHGRYAVMVGAGAAGATEQYDSAARDGARSVWPPDGWDYADGLLEDADPSPRANEGMVSWIGYC